MHRSAKPFPTTQTATDQQCTGLLPMFSFELICHHFVPHIMFFSPVIE